MTTLEQKLKKRFWAATYRNNPNNKQKILIVNTLWNKNNPEKRAVISRKCDLKKKYGLTIEEYNDIFKKQKGKCLGCNKKFITRLSASVDHSHKTGKVRGLLCRFCNLALGSINDNPTTLKNLAAYLIENNEKKIKQRRIKK